MLRATLHQPVPLQVLISDGRADLFARARLYNDSVLTETVSLPFLAEGVYGAQYIFSTEGYYTVIYQLFYDSGFTSPADYDLEAEIVEVSSDKTNLLRVLGLLHQNTVFDNQAYDSSNNLTSGRLRVYNSKANAVTAGSTGLLFTYSVTASYTDGRLSRYSITEEP